MKFLAFAFLAGLISALGFEPVGLWPLTLVALAGAMWLVDQAPTLRSALARGWWFGFGHFVLGLNWIATAFTYQSEMPAWLGWVSVVLISLYLALFPAVAAGLAWRYGRRSMPVFVLLFAASWIVSEWLRATLFTGFAWNPLGASLLATGLAGLARWIGTYGLSGVAMLAAGGLLLAFKRQRSSLALVAPLLLAAFLLPLARARPQPEAGITLRIVQPNIGQQDKWREGFETINFNRLERLSSASGSGPRLLLWPEAAVTDPLQDERRGSETGTRALRAQVAALLRPEDVLLTGGITLRSRDGIRMTSATNSVFAMDARGRIVSRYDKAHLVPYGEYLPMRPLLSAIGLSRLAPGDVDFDPGPGPQTLLVPGIGKVGFQLCYEMIFSGHVVDRRDRPDFIFNPSNDAWFGAWGPPQHLAQARLRAIEEGLPVLRSTPTGISAVIDADGIVLRQLPWRTAGTIDTNLPPPRKPTLFARVGNLMSFLFALALHAVAIAVARKTR